MAEYDEEAAFRAAIAASLEDQKTTKALEKDLERVASTHSVASVEDGSGGTVYLALLSGEEIPVPFKSSETTVDKIAHAAKKAMQGSGNVRLYTADGLELEKGTSLGSNDVSDGDLITAIVGGGGWAEHFPQGRVKIDDDGTVTHNKNGNSKINSRDCAVIGEDVLEDGIFEADFTIVKSQGNNGCNMNIGVIDEKAVHDPDSSKMWEHKHNRKIGWVFNCYFHCLRNITQLGHTNGDECTEFGKSLEGRCNGAKVKLVIDLQGRSGRLAIGVNGSKPKDANVDLPGKVRLYVGMMNDGDAVRLDAVSW